MMIFCFSLLAATGAASIPDLRRLFLDLYSKRQIFSLHFGIRKIFLWKNKGFLLHYIFHDCFENSREICNYIFHDCFENNREMCKTEYFCSTIGGDGSRQSASVAASFVRVFETVIFIFEGANICKGQTKSLATHL